MLETGLMQKNKYIIRKNTTLYDNGAHSISSPIQIIDIFDNLEVAIQELYKNIMLNSELYNANGDWIIGQSEREIYKRLMFKNVYKNQKSLDEIIISKKDSLFNSDLDLSTKIETINEAVFFNLLSPLNIFEILVTPNNYLYIPKFNPDFFNKVNKTIPFQLRGLYTDELDFWTSHDCIDCINLDRFFGNSIDIKNNEIIDINDKKWNDNYYYIIKEDRLTLNAVSPFSVFKLNKDLKIPFVIFEKIDLEFSKIRAYEKELHKEMVMSMILSDYYYDFDNLNFEEYIQGFIGNLSFDISLTLDLIKEIILENKEEIIQKIKEIHK